MQIFSACKMEKQFIPCLILFFIYSFSECELQQIQNLCLEHGHEAGLHTERDTSPLPGTLTHSHTHFHLETIYHLCGRWEKTREPLGDPKNIQFCAAEMTKWIKWPSFVLSFVCH